MYNKPLERPWYNRREELNPLLNGLQHSDEGLETIVKNPQKRGTGLFQRAALSGISLLTAFLIACSGGSAPTVTPTNTPVPVRTAPAPGAISTQQVVKNGVVIKYNKTDSRGIATFVDSTTDQTVTVEVVDSSSKPLYGMRVQYLDSKDFEGFIVEDPNNQYASLFRVYPHNAVPPITTNIPTTPLYIPLTMRISGPKVREVKGSSAEKQALDNLVEHAKNEWLYLGRRTPEQLDAENKIYSFIAGLAGINTSVVSDVAGRIADISDSISGWHEPKFYDVYEIIPTNPITTTIRVLIPVQSKPEPAPTISITPSPDKKQIPDGSKVVFHMDTRVGEEIYLINILTQEVSRLTHTEPFYDYDPAISPDGSKVVFVSGRGGKQTLDMWLMDIETRRIARLTDTDLTEYKPSWSKDGKKIVFRANVDVYSINLYQDDCKLKLAETKARGYNQSFSPDGSQIVYQDFIPGGELGSGTLTIMTVNSDGSNPSKIKDMELFEEPDWYRGFINFDWSISGKIATIMWEGSKSENKKYNGVVIIENGDWSNPRKISWDYIGTFDSLLGGYHSPSWSHDGKFLFFQQDIAQSLPGVAWTGKNDPLIVINPETGNAMDVYGFKWKAIDTPLTEVSLGELLGIEGKQPYNAECSHPQDKNQEADKQPTHEEGSTLESTIKYVWNINADDIKYSFDGDREVKVKVVYDAERLKESEAELNKKYQGGGTIMLSDPVGLLTNTIHQKTLTKSTTISSAELKRNPATVITQLESILLNDLKGLGVLRVDVLYLKEGNVMYTN